ncbi:hypothetical protein JIR001_18900 [Polycladomyces abyssicola]|uniref:ATP-grasp domain-containing protein n=1 Tax=Polycladomyces abyssicola TaxID=1125966 RepID=A0A8D5UF00_9BACL|nr:YheC/YheD family protein [Polycladomyces abyssicola]BCU82107.1 hypothetical protein JIR001_18900 [Polycladomyces abyssicola]
MAVQKYVSNKMKYHDILVEDPVLFSLVPETFWLTDTALTQLLLKYSAVYIKPNSNHRGNGILKVSLNGTACCIQHSFHDQSYTVPLANVYKTVKQGLKAKQKYIVQQGINLATFNGFPFDVRVLMHRPLDRWQISGWLARVATSSNQIVTNHIRGAEPVPLEKALSELPKNPTELVVELSDKCHQTASLLGQYFDLRIVGLDMAVDQQGRIWFLEMNSSPMFRKMFKELGDSSMYQRAIKTHRYIVKKYS